MSEAIASIPPKAVATSVPPWPLIHFDVHCARCGHDLRGQTEPNCPACKLEFSWEQAAPLELLTCSKCNYHLYGIADARCPECGEAVDWNEALLRYRRREKPLFEYRWRDRPIRSFFRTWLLALRPKRLWQTVDIHDPPQVRPLFVWTAILLVITVLSGPFWVGIQVTVSNAQVAPPGVPWSSYFDYLLRTWLTAITSQTIAFAALMYLLWWSFSLAALLIFRQSMRLCRVRSAHVFRACAYGLAPLLPFYVMLASLLPLVWYPRPSRSFLTSRSFSANGVFVFWCVAYLVVVWAIRQAYRHYIRMPHSLGVAIASQVIAILATAAIPSALFRLIRGDW